MEHVFLKLPRFRAFVGFAIGFALVGCAGSPARETRTDPVPKVDPGPEVALELLAESNKDTCAVCVRELRREAFEFLEEQFPPGTIIHVVDERALIRAHGINELQLSPFEGDNPRLTFRYHTLESHLVGIAESDFTDTVVAGHIGAEPPGMHLQGSIEIVSFAYGDGPAFLYHAGSQHLQLQCKVLQINSERKPD